MAYRGKNINLFLMDGSLSGRIKVTISNWTGTVYRIPRSELEDCQKIAALSQSGVYFLVGPGTASHSGTVYIGQAGPRKSGTGILKRLLEHNRNPDKDYWSQAVVFTTSNNSFGPTELNFLENRFCNMALHSHRYDVKNENDPTLGNITEEKESELEEYVDYAQLILEVLGYQIFSSPGGTATLPAQDAPVERPAPPAARTDAAETDLKIGKFVQAVIAPAMQKGLIPPEEMSQLTALDYCKQVFGRRVYYPVLKEWPEGSTQSQVAVINGHRRYYLDIVIPCGTKRYLLSSQWYKDSWQPLLAWYRKFT